MNKQILETAQAALSEFFDNLVQQFEEKEGTNVESRLSEAEQAERFEVASALFDDLLGTSTVEALEEAARKAQGEDERVEEAGTFLDDLLGGGKLQKQAQEGKDKDKGKGKATRTVEIPILKRDRVHGLSVVGYRSVEVENEDDPPTGDEKALQEAAGRWDELAELLAEMI